MRKRSKLFLIVSGGIFLVGVVLCLVAYFMAGSTGEGILANNMGEGKGYSYRFNDEDLDSLKLSVDDADINIVGGSKDSYIELINFKESLYTFAKNNATATFIEKPDFTSVSGIWESGFTFKGLRYFLFPGVGEGRKTINVFLSDEMQVRSVNVSANMGTVTITNIKCNANYSLSTGAASVVMEGISTEGELNIKTDTVSTAKWALNTVSAGDVKINAPVVHMELSKFSAAQFSLSAAEGSAKIDFTPISKIGYTATVFTKGKLLVNGGAGIDSFSFSNLDSTAVPDSEDGEEATPANIKINTDRAESDLSVELTIPEYVPNMEVE